MSYPAIFLNGNVNGGCPPVFEHTISYSVSQLSVSFSTTTALGVAPYTYEWEFGDGHSSNLQNPVHTYAAASNFYVTLTAMDALFCQHDTTITLLSGIFTGISDDVAKSVDPILFPNPGCDQIFLEIQSGQELPVSYEVYDLAGKLIISQTELVCNGNRQYRIQTSSLKPGMYCLHSQTKSGFNSISKFTILK
jgi:hypothetical protein